MTRAYAITRFQARDFTIYTAENGGLDRLGLSFVNKVPRQKHRYEKWLEDERERFLSKIIILETDILVFTKKEMEDLGKDNSEPKYDILRDKHDYSSEEDNETGIPCSLNIANSYTTPDWIYIIDLDKELFTIDSCDKPGYGKVWFRLWNLPSERWFNVFHRHGFTSQCCSQAIDRIELTEGPDYDPSRVTEIQNSQNEDEESTVRFNVKPVERAMGIDQMNALALFHKINAQALRHWWTHIPDEGPNTFAFQEVAFAILSLAAGQFDLARSGKLIDRQGGKGFYFDFAEPENPRLISNLGAEFVIEGYDRGSSPPNKTLYWFQHVLVNLISDELLKYNIEAAIAEITGFARKDGKTNYYALLFSIRNFVLLEFHEIEGTCTIRQTDIISIREALIGNHRDVLFTTHEKTSTVYPNFKIMQDFFANATARQLALSRDMLPLDICAEIYEHLDPMTRNACASVSPFMSTIHRRLLRVSHGLSSLDLHNVSSSIGMIPPGWNSMSGSILIDEGSSDTFAAETFADPGSISASARIPWTPIIGSWYRPSMIMLVSLTFKVYQHSLLSGHQRHTLERWSPPSSKPEKRRHALCG